jgi:hypothetical protein
MKRYDIVRFFQRSEREVIKRGLTLEEAQAHCTDPETSSKTATSAEAQERTRTRGEWFDGYRDTYTRPRPQGLLDTLAEICYLERKR